MEMLQKLKKRGRLKNLTILILTLLVILLTIRDRNRVSNFNILSTWNPAFINTDKFEKMLNLFIFNSKSKEIKQVEYLKNLQVSKLSNEEARTIFFQTISLPLQGVCRLMKRVGGHWVVGDPDYGQHRAVDGDKFVCLDQILDQDQCVIYSFGISSDWTFEDQMDELDCYIYAYDHTTLALPWRGQNIKFFKTGVGYGPSLKPLSQIIKENSHQTTVIDYLKIDIEGYEFSDGGFTDWIKSGALTHVKQLAIELHINHEENNERQYIEILKILQDLYVMGFKVISHEPNMVKGPGPNGFYNFVEVVLMK